MDLSEDLPLVTGLGRVRVVKMTVSDKSAGSVCKGASYVGLQQPSPWLIANENVLKLKISSAGRSTLGM